MRDWSRNAKAWAAIVGAIGTFVAGAMTGIVGYVNNKEKIESQFNSLSSWFYKSERWNGYVDSYPEGRVDMASMELSETEMRIAISASDGGALDGMISDRRLCKVSYPHDFKLLRGQVSWFGNSADVTVWDIVQGIPTDFAEFKIKVDDQGVYEIKPKRNSRWFGEQPIRLGKHPTLTFEQGAEMLNNYCIQEQKELLSRVAGRPPADESGIELQKVLRLPRQTPWARSE